MKMGILWTIRNTLKSKFFKAFLFIAVLCVVAPVGADAKTVSGSLNYASEERLLYFENLFKRSGYQNYLLVIENVDISYYSSNSYYICLTDYVEFTDNLNASATCGEMYHYYRYSNNDYILEKIDDDTLTVNNSVFYTNNIYDTNYVLIKFMISLNIGLVCFFLTYVLFKIFRS